MKILCVVDHFGSGGAQRQMVNLACGLKEKGHSVEIFIYHPEHSFFRSKISLANIPIHEVNQGQGFSLYVLWSLALLLKRGSYTAVISFLNAPNIYVELASVIAKSTKVIVSERSSHLAETMGVQAFLRRALHCFANAVVANSNSHRNWLIRYPWLRKRAKVIYNGYFLKVGEEQGDTQFPELNLLVVGRVGPEKNGLRLIEALEIFHRRNGYVPRINWAGKEDISPSGSGYCERLHVLLDKYPVVKANWNWLGERKDIDELLQKHRALIHPSLYEGLPNAVCEALIAGCPILASNVCDHSILVKDREHGFLFDPLDPNSIANAIESLVSLTEAQWRLLSVNARNFAFKALSISRMVQSYEELIINKQKT